MDFQKNTKSKSLNFLQNILYGLSKKYKTKISELPTKYSVWILEKYKIQISELPTKYSVWTFKKIQNPNL
jgi:hypothetical protein